MLDALAPARRRFVLGVVVLVVLLAGTGTVIALARGTDSVSAVAQDAQPPVLLVPGYGGSTTGLTVLARALRSAGRTVEVVDLGVDSRADFHVQATRLDDAV